MARGQADVLVPAVLGCAAHSGWAALVGITLADGAPRVVARERLELSDPGDHQARQPYHAVEELPIEQARARLAAWETEAARKAREGIAALVERLAGAHRRVQALGILDSAGRRGGSLEAILAAHPLIHTAEGEHFRAALAAGAASCKLAVERVPARSLEAEAARAIGRTPQAIQRVLQALGREVGPPWTTDQKSAALLAWRLLAA